MYSIQETKKGMFETVIFPTRTFSIFSIVGFVCEYSRSPSQRTHNFWIFTTNLKIRKNMLLHVINKVLRDLQDILNWGKKTKLQRLYINQDNVQIDLKSPQPSEK